MPRPGAGDDRHLRQLFRRRHGRGLLYGAISRHAAQGDHQVGRRPQGVATGPTAYPGLMPASLTTLPHFSVSSAMCLLNSAGVIGNGTLLNSAMRAVIVESLRAALMSLLSFSMISAGTPFGAPMPNQ